MKQTKYKAVRTGQFDSKAEAKRHAELLLLEKAGIIHGLSVHPWFELQPAFKSKSGGYYRAIGYEADFTYYEKHNGESRVVIEDVKGFPTPAFKIKEKLFRFKFPDAELRIVGAKNSKGWKKGHAR